MKNIKKLVIALALMLSFLAFTFSGYFLYSYIDNMGTGRYQTFHMNLGDDIVLVYTMDTATGELFQLKWKDSKPEVWEMVVKPNSFYRQ